MTFTSFLLQLGWNLLTSILPMALIIYASIRFAIKHGVAESAKVTRPQPVQRIVNE